jgi:hypothetical protein
MTSTALNCKNYAKTPSRESPVKMSCNEDNWSETGSRSERAQKVSCAEKRMLGQDRHHALKGREGVKRDGAVYPKNYSIPGIGSYFFFKMGMPVLSVSTTL